MSEAEVLSRDPLNVRITGIGGQGVLTIAKLLGQALVRSGRHATLLQKFDAFISGGESTAEMRVSSREITYPVFEEADVAVFMAPRTFHRYAGRISRGAVVIVNSDTIKEDVDRVFAGRASAVYKVPASSEAMRLGNLRAANMVILGALVAKVPLAEPEVVAELIRERFPRAAEVNVKAFWRGYVLAGGDASRVPEEVRSEVVG